MFFLAKIKNMTKEKTFENKVKSYLKSKNVWFVKFFANGYTQKGVPDLLCCANGRFLAIEIKREGGRATPLQLYTIDKIKHAGGVALVLYPHDFDAFKELITKLLNSPREGGE